MPAFSISTCNSKAHTEPEEKYLVPTIDNSKKKIEELRRQRAPLFKEFEKTPYNLSLALKIKAIDDEMAACSESMTQEKRRG